MQAAPILRLHHETEDGPSAAWSPDGTRILTFGESPMQLFRENGIKLGEMAHDVYGAQWSKTGDRILSYGPDGMACLWDGFTGAGLLRCEHAFGSAWAEAQWNHDETVLLTQFNNEAVIWDIASGERLHTFQTPKQIHTTRWMFNETQVLTASDDLAIRLWDVVTGNELAVFQSDADDSKTSYPSFSAEASHNERYILAGGSRFTKLNVWEVSTKQIVYTLSAPADLEVAWQFGWRYGPQWASDDSRIVTCSRPIYASAQQTQLNKSCVISIHDAHSGIRLQDIEFSEYVWQMVWSRYKPTLLAASQSGIVLWLDTNTGSVLRQFQHDSSVEEFTWLEDEHVLITRTAAGGVYLWNTQDSSVLFETHYDGTTNSAELHPDRKRLLVSWIGNDIDVYEINLT